MATTQDRLRGVEELEELYRASPDSDQDRRPTQSDWSHRILWGWLAVFGSIVLFEPAPANPAAAVPVWANILLMVFTVALLAGVVGLSLRRAWGLRASLVAGGLGMAIGAACVLTDHHPGVWGAYEIVAFSGLAVASGVAATRAR
jgi:hypothetical protein